MICSKILSSEHLPLVVMSQLRSFLIMGRVKLNLYFRSCALLGF